MADVLEFKKGDRVKVNLPEDTRISSIIKTGGMTLYEVEYLSSGGNISFITFSGEELEKA